MDVIFATVVGVLAGVCVVLALVVAVCWLAVQARRLQAQLRQPTDAWWQQRGALAPTVRDRRP
jgi:hypothetical protein